MEELISSLIRDLHLSDPLLTTLTKVRFSVWSKSRWCLKETMVNATCKRHNMKSFHKVVNFQVFCAFHSMLRDSLSKRRQKKLCYLLIRPTQPANRPWNRGGLLNEVVGGARPLDQPLEVPPGQLHHEGGERGQRLYSKRTHLKRSTEEVSFDQPVWPHPTPSSPPHTHQEKSWNFAPNDKWWLCVLGYFNQLYPEQILEWVRPLSWSYSERPTLPPEFHAVEKVQVAGS